MKNTHFLALVFVVAVLGIWAVFELVIFLESGNRAYLESLTPKSQSVTITNAYIPQQIEARLTLINGELPPLLLVTVVSDSRSSSTGPAYYYELKKMP